MVSLFTATSPACDLAWDGWRNRQTRIHTNSWSREEESGKTGGGERRGLRLDKIEDRAIPGPPQSG